MENEKSFLKNSCEEHKHLLDVLKSSHGELKLTHEKLVASHEELLEQHTSLIKVFSKKLKKIESSSHESNDQTQHMTNSCDVGKKHVSTSCDDLLEMSCSSHIDACSTSLSCETNLLKENNELKKSPSSICWTIKEAMVTRVALASARAMSKARDGAREEMKER